MTETSPANGCTLADAILRMQVEPHLQIHAASYEAYRAAGEADEKFMARRLALLWRGLVEHAGSVGGLVFTGFITGGSREKSIPKAFIRNATPDFDRNTLGFHGAVYAGVRVFLAADALPATGVHRLEQAVRLPLQRRGPKPLKTEVAAQRMVADIRAGKTTLADLQAMKQDSRATLYDVKSRDTIRKALDLAAEIVVAPDFDK
jgi:hypothetical protein